MEEWAGPKKPINKAGVFPRPKLLGLLGLLGQQAMGRLPGPPDSNPVLRRNDFAILNFALNLEYLEAEYYTYATTGAGIADAGVGVTGTGTFGPTIVKANPAVPFATQAFREYALEIAADERAHVTFLRTVLSSLGGAPVAKPTINLRESFMNAAKAAGLGDGFDPFANEVISSSGRSSSKMSASPRTRARLRTSVAKIFLMPRRGFSRLKLITPASFVY